MRFFVTSFLFSLFFIIPAYEAYAQDSHAVSSYSSATNEQIVEAQDFYEKCKNNKTMSARKDCKCAATAYLETRVRLGSAASIDEIMDANINACLIDKEKTAIDDVEKLGLEDVTEQQIEEAESVFQWCDGDNEARRVIDCECLAAKFLTMRIERGPIKGKMSLVGEITRRECRNVVGTTGMEYVKCMKGTAVKYYNYRPKDYCECYARKWAELFGSWKGKLDESKKYSLRDRAMSYCQNPEAYK
ncbi:MAG: hypothetical protein KAJ40_01520 [Alphaproteobacteria bacterium]|nr:hypothetical protein [Alphaproteobacteria bacterium]